MNVSHQDTKRKPNQRVRESLARLFALTIKESKQLLRDPFSFVLGILLPIALLLICGYGMSTDIRNIRLAIVTPETSEMATLLTERFIASEYFDVTVVRSSVQGEALVQSHEADACVFLPQEMTRRLHEGRLRILIVVNASNPSLAYTKESYIKSVISGALSSQHFNDSAPPPVCLRETGEFSTPQRKKSIGTGISSGVPAQECTASTGVRFSSSVNLVPRLWFNDASESAYTLIPGIIVIIMIVVGSLLTSVVMAREYEQGNLESLFVTPMRSFEILLAKMINNFALGMLGLAIALAMAHGLFHVPIRSSWYVIWFGSAVFLVMALCMGLLISSVTKNQFIAVEVAAFSTFLPSFLLSGFLFEIKSMPLILQWITVFVPARYYVDFLQTAFLVGDVWPNIVKNIGILLLFAIGFMLLAAVKNPKRLEG